MFLIRKIKQFLKHILFLRRDVPIVTLQVLGMDLDLFKKKIKITIQHAPFLEENLDLQVIEDSDHQIICRLSKLKKSSTRVVCDVVFTDDQHISQTGQGMICFLDFRESIKAKALLENISMFSSKIFRRKQDRMFVIMPLSAILAHLPVTESLRLKQGVLPSNTHLAESYQRAILGLYFGRRLLNVIEKQSRRIFYSGIFEREGETLTFLHDIGLVWFLRNRGYLKSIKTLKKNIFQKVKTARKTPVYAKKDYQSSPILRLTPTLKETYHDT